MRTAAPNRRLVHTRDITARAFARDDGLWDIEAALTDTKGGDFKLATGVRPAGEPVHDMRLSVTIDTELNVMAASAQALRVPYPGHCETIEAGYTKLVGLNLLRNFRADVRERLGGIAGCSHLTELAAVLPTTAIQAFAGEVYKTRDTSQESASGVATERQPWQLDRCHALRVDGPAVAHFYPRWFKPAVTPLADETDHSFKAST